MTGLVLAGLEWHRALHTLEEVWLTLPLTLPLTLTLTLTLPLTLTLTLTPVMETEGSPVCLEMTPTP